MNEWILSLIEEKKLLDKERYELYSYLISPEKHEPIPFMERLRLTKKFNEMMVYSDKLTNRIKLLDSFESDLLLDSSEPQTRLGSDQETYYSGISLESV